MPWFPVDDTAAFHPKLVAAGNTAIGMWARAGAWCAQQLTDGFVPDHMIGALGNTAQARQLVNVGLWTREDGGYQFHEWDAPGRNLTRKEIEAKRAEERERKAAYRAGKRGGSPPGRTQESLPLSQRDTHGTDAGTPTGQTPDVRRDTHRSPTSSRARPRGRAPIPSHPIPSGTGPQSSTDPSAPDQTTKTIDDEGLDQIASATHGNRAHAEHVAGDILERANGSVRDPLGYVLRAIGAEPDRYRATPRPRGRCPTCQHFHAADAPHVTTGGTDEPPW